MSKNRLGPAGDDVDDVGVAEPFVHDPGAELAAVDALAGDPVGDEGGDVDDDGGTGPVPG
jgi:hypothetical protein